MSLEIQFYVVDVFATEKYTGNQLAVFIDLEKVLSNEQMLAITREINFAESTFVRNINRDESVEVRIFTTEYEVPFAGHPTLGTAYIIAKYLSSAPSPKVVLQLKKGAIPVQINMPENLKDSRFTMRQAQPNFGATYNAELVAKALYLPLTDVDLSMPIQEVDTGLPYLIIFLKDLKSIGRLQLNSEKVEQFLKREKLFKTNNARGLTTSLFFVSKETVDTQHQYHTRMFVLEGNAIWEDAATGSANGCFLAYLLKHRRTAVSAIVEQGFEMGRKSILYLDGELKNDEYILNVGGQVAAVAKGSWLV